jgi:endoglucanase
MSPYDQKGDTQMCIRSSYSQSWQRILFLLSIPILGMCSVALGQGTGYWHTSGNQIIDSSGRSIRIAGINWYGFETTDQVVHGLWAQDYHTILKAIKSNGYNAIRLPYSNQMVETPIVPKNISFSNGGAINTDLKELNALLVMDKIISAAGALGLRVILDNHRSEAGNSAEANGLWHTGAYPESVWINDWKMLVSRYSGFKDASGNPTVVAVDLRNEPHVIANGSPTGACWTGDASTGGCPTTNTAQNWSSAAQRAGNAVLSANPNLLIIVEGVDCYNGDCDWWGGNLEGVSSHPIGLSVSNRLVYSAHDYGPNLYRQSWFNSSTNFSSLSSVWSKFWGYISANHIAPVLIGEFGTGNNASDIQSVTPGSQGQWFESLVNFLQNNPSLNWTYWALNGEDSYALLDNLYDSTPASSLKQGELASIQSALSGGGSGSGTCSVLPSAPSGLAAAAVSSSQINLSWTAVTPLSNCSIKYRVFRSTTSGFTPSSSNQVASGLATPSFTNTGLSTATTYYYKVEAVDAVGASTPSNQASATTQSSSGGFACHVVYTNVNQWSTGFQAAITIQNTGTVGTTNWTLKWTFPGNQQITNLWNGSYVQSGPAVTVQNLSYNGSIPPGGGYSGLGFTANFSGTNPAPASFSVNGVACR